MSKRIRVYTEEDVAEHNNLASCWVIRDGKIYDVTAFLADHPGGDDMILNHAGRSVGDVMRDKLEHEHSDAAYDILRQYMVGKLGTSETIVDENWEATDDFHPDNTEVEKDFERNQFLDLRKPLMRQMWEANFSKAYYVRQIHQPRHLSGRSARLFGSDFLEFFTRTKWYVIPTIWLPIAGYLFLRSVFQFAGALPTFWTQPALPLSALSEVPVSTFAKVGMCFLLGNFLWTILEYILHRFLFHLDQNLPDHPMFFIMHFLLHGIHHYLPMDGYVQCCLIRRSALTTFESRLRLVMPPVLFATLQFPFTRLAYALFPVAIANGIIAGAFTFYVGYDCMHYALHHSKLPGYLADMKRYHLGHHYKNYELAFGVTSKIWDIVFNTYLPI
ncbi:oxidoreductase [Fistulina hepatica ATCC 64428]|uniref:Ceramide very long chain fatty acid hydroxylase n=1 Tax=Fistulina hepatica ATCC 64428 TaxID=1128425 RepID=A0A0D7A2K7_9AGAR|nr:oxidoreductase [Fistulina hepatica ATCC 64428]